MRALAEIRWSRCGASWLVLLLAVGCGGTDRARVSGMVLRHDGSPVEGAYVIARSSETGVSARGMTDAEGRYELGTEVEGDGVPPGDYYVIIIEERNLDDTRPRTIPARYSRSTASGLQLSVAAAEPIDFDVKLDPQ